MKNIISRLFLIQIILLSITGTAIAAWNEPYFILRDSDRPSLIQDNNGSYWIAFNSWTNPQNIWIMIGKISLSGASVILIGTDQLNPSSEYFI